MWAKLRSTRGVLRIVSFGNRPASIGDEVIAHIKDSLDKVAELGGIKPGQSIELSEGPFKGLNAVFLSYDGEERAIVLIHFMQKQQAVRVSLASINN